MLSKLASHDGEYDVRMETPELVGEIAVQLSDHSIVEIAQALGLDIEIETVGPATEPADPAEEATPWPST